MTALIERDAVLQVLGDRLRAVAAGTGHVALLEGEAGIGKTSVLQALRSRADDAVVWWGACDALGTPHPLAPLHDIARDAQVSFRGLLADERQRPALFDAVLTELQRSRRAILLVIEDAHWADDATLDLLKFIGRRIDRAPCLLVMSYRDDEVTVAHPLRRVIGELSSRLVTRVPVPRLTRSGVEQLARNAMRVPAGVFDATHGNPFFVTELLRHGAAGIPRGVQDLVLARYSRLGAEAQAVLRLVSLVPARIERWLVEKVGAGAIAPIEECLNSGLLIGSDDTLSFRHELARAAIESALPAPVAQASHADLLAALATRDKVSLARLVHHATRARDAAAVMRHAPVAAREAELRGAHREAAAHYSTLLQFAADAPLASRKAWLDGHARESQLIDQLEAAIASRLELDRLHRQDGDAIGEAENQSQLAIAYVLALRNADADAASRRAIARLEALPPSPALARVMRVEAQLRMLNRDVEAAVSWGSQSIALAERFGDREALAAALCTVGAATIFLDFDAGVAHLRRSLDIAMPDGRHLIAANALVNLGSAAGELHHWPEARRWLLEAIAFSTRYEIDFYRNYSVAWLALCELHAGEWDEAEEHALDIVESTTQRTTGRVMALAALGRLRARRGIAGADAALDEGLELALESGTLQRVGPIRLARAEAAQLRGDLAAMTREAQLVLALADRQRHPWFAGEAAWWLTQTGERAAPTVCAEPYALQIGGRWRDAAEHWSALGCPYEQARALEAGDAAAGLEALAVFESLGAGPAAQRLRRRLRTEGQQRLPKLPRASTQANPLGLTAREIEIVALLCEGLKNSEMAERLSRSVRTVDHHVAAVFDKLGVTNRADAVQAARAAGIGNRPVNG